MTVLVQRKGAKRFAHAGDRHHQQRRLLELQLLHARRKYWRVRWTSPAGVKYEGPAIRAY